MMSVLMNTIVFEDCRNQWSVSRPLLGLILLHEKVSGAAGGTMGTGPGQGRGCTSVHTVTAKDRGATELELGARAHRGRAVFPQEALPQRPQVFFS